MNNDIIYFSKNKIFKYIYYLLLIIIIIFGFSIIIYGFIIDSRQLLLGFLIIISAIIYHINTKRKIYYKIYINDRFFKILNIISCFILIYTLLYWHDNPHTYIYTILFSLLYSLIIFEILYTKHYAHCIIKIILLSCIYRYLIFYGYPSLVGYDALTHYNISETISILGTIPTNEYVGKYAYYPIFHIMVAITQILTNENIKNVAFYSIGIIGISSLIYIYILGKKLTNRYVIGLISIFFAACFYPLILRGIINVTPGSLVLSYLLCILIIISKYILNISYIILLLIIMISSIFTHQLSVFVSVFIIFTLFLGMVLFKYLNKKKDKHTYISSLKYFLFLYILTMSVTWIYINIGDSKSFFDSVVDPFIRVLMERGQYEGTTLLMGTKDAISPINYILIQLPYLLIPICSIFALFSYLSKRNMQFFSYFVTLGFLGIMIYIIPMVGIKNLFTDRWIPFISIFILIGFAIFFYKFIIYFNKNIQVPLAFFITFLLIISMINTPEINNNSIFDIENNKVRNQFNNNEIEGIYFIMSYIKEPIYIDISYSILLSYYINTQKYSKKVKIIPLSYENILSSNNIVDNSVIILRLCSINESISIKRNNKNIDIKLPENYFILMEKTKNIIYNNKNVIVYK